MKMLILAAAVSTMTAFGAMAHSDSSAKINRAGADNAAPAFLVSNFSGMTLYAVDQEDARKLREIKDSDDRRRQGMSGADDDRRRQGMAGADDDRSRQDMASTRRDQRGQTGRDQAGAQSRSMSYAERDGMRWRNSQTQLSGSDRWEDVGEIGDVVMSKQGEIRGVILDVGGFLGMGVRNVMVDIDELHFVSEKDNPEEIDDYRVVTTMSKDELENLPEWDEDQLRRGFSSQR